MSIGEWIHAYRMEHKLSMADFAKQTGLSKASIGFLEKSDSNPTTKTLTKIASAAGISLQELMEQMASVSPATPPQIPSALAGIKNIVPIEKRMIPIIGTICAGETAQADEQIEVHVPCDTKCHIDFALRMPDDSMAKSGIKSGDVVFIHRQTQVDDKQLAAVTINGSTTLRHFYRMPDGCMLLSSNPKQAPIFFHEDEAEHIQILGLAVAQFSWF